MTFVNLRAIGGAHAPEAREIECDACGEPIPTDAVEACTHVPPDYLPEDFRKRATTILCKQCTPEEQ